MRNSTVSVVNMFICKLHSTCTTTASTWIGYMYTWPCSTKHNEGTYSYSVIQLRFYTSLTALPDCEWRIRMIPSQGVVWPSRLQYNIDFLRPRWCELVRLTAYILKYSVVLYPPTHIFDSFEAVPPVTLCTLSCESSVFSSSNCFTSSSLVFVLSSCAFSFPCTTKGDIPL